MQHRSLGCVQELLPCSPAPPAGTKQWHRAQPQHLEQQGFTASTRDGKGAGLGQHHVRPRAPPRPSRGAARKGASRFLGLLQGVGLFSAFSCNHICGRGIVPVPTCCWHTDGSCGGCSSCAETWSLSQGPNCSGSVVLPPARGQQGQPSWPEIAKHRGIIGVSPTRTREVTLLGQPTARSVIPFCSSALTCPLQVAFARGSSRAHPTPWGSSG